MHEDKLPKSYKHQTLRESFKSAFRGLTHAIGERNFRVQLAVGIIAIALAFILDIPTVEQMLVIVLTALVLGAELLNSAFEIFLDFMIKEHNAEVAKTKELLSAAVLIFSIAALVLGLWIFGKALFF